MVYERMMITSKSKYQIISQKKCTINIHLCTEAISKTNENSVSSQLSSKSELTVLHVNTVINILSFLVHQFIMPALMMHREEFYH